MSSSQRTVQEMVTDATPDEYLQAIQAALRGSAEPSPSAC